MMVRLWIIASSEDRDPTRTTEGRESDVAVQKTQQKQVTEYITGCNVKVSRYIILDQSESSKTGSMKL